MALHDSGNMLARIWGTDNPNSGCSASLGSADLSHGDLGGGGFRGSIGGAHFPGLAIQVFRIQGSRYLN